jgi:hypothetical protein
MTGKFVTQMIPAALTHTVRRIPKVGQDAGGEPLFGGATGAIACFVDGSSRRVLTPNGREVRMDFEVILLPEQPIAVGDKLQQAVTSEGTVLFTDAVVHATDLVSHPRHGIVGRYCSVKTGI